ncbi:MAG: DUF6599 family protein [bacterium]
MRSFGFKVSLILLVGISLAALCVSAQVSPDPLGLLPGDDEVKGWVRDGEPAIATDLKSLTDLIDGAAPQYIDRGAKKVVFQDYSLKGEMFLTVEIYGMESPQNAQTLYKDIFLEEPTALKGVGEAARLAEKLVGAYVLEFRKGRFFVRVTTTAKTDEAKSAALSFAKIIDGRIK